MKISRYVLREVIRYYEDKEAGRDVLAGIRRSSTFGDLNLTELEKAIREGTLELES